MRDALGSALRDVALRGDDAGCWEFVRTLTGWVAVREIILFCWAERVLDAFCGVLFRDIVVALRTAASETPMPIKHAKTTGNTFLILTINVMLAKKIVFGQGLFNKKAN